MNKQSEIRNPKSEIAIVGAGPAGSSLAIRLARAGFEVTLVEREKFPRQKLCGEFISPECLAHFRELDVLDEMLAAGGERVTETVFYAPNGRSVTVPSAWLGTASGALGLSRAEMDWRLLEKARETGVRILEETQVTGITLEKDRVAGLKARSKNNESFEIAADLTIDATGRLNVLAKFAQKLQITNNKLQTQNKNPKTKTQNPKPKLIGFKAHLENARLEKGRCEIYFFRGGYGGLSHVENDLANHCFLVSADVVKKYIGQTNLLVEEVIYENRRAREALKDARVVSEWLAVSVDAFGLKDLTPAKNLFAVGDAAAFIDPFTGSGMLMALEGAEILAKAVKENSLSPAEIAAEYNLNFERRFRKRLRVCALLRRAAFVPNLAGTVISVLNWSRPAQEMLARSTRPSSVIKKSNAKI